LFIAVLLLAVPILDTSVAVTSRLRRGVSPFQGGHDHLSHRLIRGGVSRPLAAVSLWALSAVFAGAALLVTMTERSGQQVVVGSALVIWIVLFIKFSMSADA
jgi:UDP-GlcNAc:undecaprenyl-phosphate GlcNAc-1-phosphate transferase